MTWDPDYLAEFNRRLDLRNKLKNDLKLRKAVMTYYASDPKAWFNDWAITFDPRAQAPRPRLLPFILFPRQEQWIDCLQGCLKDKEAMLTEKCRDIGATWEAADFSVWLWNFHAGSIIGWGSRKAEYVDKMGDLKAIFPKIRLQLQYMPPWMLPEGFSLAQHATYMNIRNPVNMSAIVGEAGDSMGRGGRTTLYFKDESAHYENPESVEAALGDNTDVPVDISSVNGPGNVFHRKRMAGEVWEEGKPSTPNKTRVFIFDWRDHPGKTQQWYDKRRLKAEEEGLLHIFAQEVDRDYLSAVEGVIIKPLWVQAAIDAHIKLKFDDSGKKIMGQDIADGGLDKNALLVRYGVVARHAEHWGGEANAAARKAIPIADEWKCEEVHYDSIGVGVGFRAEIVTMEREGLIPKRLKILPWAGSAEVLDPEKPIVPEDKESRKNKDHYKNLKAQAWFRTRARFIKTFQAVTMGKEFDPAELISLDSKCPALHSLTMELSQATVKLDNAGKTLVDKSPDGTSSPNLAPALFACARTDTDP